MNRNFFVKLNRRLRKIIVYCVVIMIVIYLCTCFSMRLSVRDTSFAKEECMLYYIVNVDGMKGLGHSILLVVNEEGYATILSFNGMQRSLQENLLGKSGIGKMSVEQMTARQTEEFLQTGDLKLDGDQLSDNYDIALYRPISTQEYDVILDQITPYIEAQEHFIQLYEKWATEKDVDRKEKYKQDLEQMGQEESLPLYQIYTYNCDHAARRLIASIDRNMQEYSQHSWCMTPTGNIKAFGQSANKWGVTLLGKQSLLEKVLMFLVVF